MNKYEGMNLPDLMDLMHGIVMPKPVSMVPETIGWAFVLLWGFSAVLLIYWHFYKRWKSNAYRREASRNLEKIQQRIDEPDFNAGYEIALLLKQTALAAYPRSRVASLTGEQWAQFLCESSGGNPEVSSVAEDIARASYRHVPDCAALIQPARRWIEVHRA